MQNGTLFQFFHWYISTKEPLWKHLAKETPKLADLGVTAVWTPPAFKGSKGKDSVGYDLYDLYDLGEFDQKGTRATRWGTKQEYLDAIKTLQDAGIQVYADIIINHLCGADATERVPVKKVNPEDRLEFISDQFDIEAHTIFNFPGRNQYSEFKWDYQCFSGVDCAADLDESGIFSIQNQYGEGWQEVADHEHNNYDFLFGADIDYRNPAVRDEVKRWGAWYWETAGFDGVRLDAVKHVPTEYLGEWLRHVRDTAGKNLFAVAEYWSPEKLDDMLQFIDKTGGKIALFDAPLHCKLYTASKQGKEFDLRYILNDTLVAENPSLAVTIVGNHDTQPLQLLEAPLEDWFKPHAYSLILLREQGYPCVFYPDVYGATYTDKDKEGKDCTIELRAVPGLEKMLTARKELAYGVQRDFFDDANCIGWTREGDDEHNQSGCAVLISNGDAAEKRMEIGKRHAGKRLHDLLDNTEGDVTVEEDGWAGFRCPAGGVSVWVF